MQYHGGIREINSMPIYIFCFILCSILLHDEDRLDSFIPRSYLRHEKGPDLNLAPQSTIYSYTPDHISTSSFSRDD